MASWYVFEPPKTLPDTAEAAGKALFIKDGFSIGAFLLGPFWLLWRRMWLVFLFWLVAQIALLLIARVLHFDERLAGLVSLLFSLCVSLEANALRAWTLRRKGWRFLGLALGHSLVEAEQRHFSERTLVEPPKPLPPARPRHPGPTRPHEGHDGVLGVFPDVQGSRP
ncbi:DUF2628 domain-containing protein [Labrys okinawensis]|uniref:DUF2628 domain-containing protein n=1 Tax=Labrys okinawensis TaxID=346911 RepID=UPI0039BD6D15